LMKDERPSSKAPSNACLLATASIRSPRRPPDQYVIAGDLQDVAEVGHEHRVVDRRG
jgi:hypothetical protein